MYNFSEYTQKVYVREQYYNDEIFPEGMKVRNGNDQVGTIIRRGPNYVICLERQALLRSRLFRPCDYLQGRKKEAHS